MTLHIFLMAAVPQVKKQLLTFLCESLLGYEFGVLPRDNRNDSIMLLRKFDELDLRPSDHSLIKHQVRIYRLEICDTEKNTETKRYQN